MDGLPLDIAHMLAGGMVLVSFMLLYQDRMFALLNVFALHAVVLSAVSRLAGPHSKCAASLCSGGDRPRAQRHHHSGRLAPGRDPTRHPPHHRDRRRHRPNHALWHQRSLRSRWS